jgi:hypothetical protein
LQCRVYAPVGGPRVAGFLLFLIAAIDRRNGAPGRVCLGGSSVFSFVRQGLARFPCGREHGAAERVFVGGSGCKRAAFKREEQQCSG